MIKALIFDLDNCLAEAKEVGEELYKGPFNAIREANDGALSDETLNMALAETWRHPLDWVAKRFGFTTSMLEAGWKTFSNLEVHTPMKGYDDLAQLLDLHVQRFLVTSGFFKLQQSKIAALDLASMVDEIFIDAIDRPDRIGKKGIFKNILHNHNLTPGDVLVIGDNADSEIKAGNELGIKTVQTLRPGVSRTESATYHIHSIGQLLLLLSGNVITKK